MTSSPSTPQDYLQFFGLKHFRPAQEAVIATVLAGRDCLCIMPTGGGKSLCYQLPAIMRPGLTLVVSPLIALMKDQVDALKQKGIRAELINSTVHPAEQTERMQRMAAGQYDLVYVAPERFRSQRFIELLRATSLTLLAVDEAHCISEWGHDFRHDYARLGQYRRRIGNPPTIALTATATPDVQQDVIQQLGLNEPRTFVAGFARENLEYSVWSSRALSEKDATLLRLVRTHPGAGIVYAATRKACGELAGLLQSQTDRTVRVYHAGLESAERKAVQEAFMSGEASIIVATNAFGMGIDKPNVRFVIHYNMPGTLEAYYQEAGRAGRDGLTSRCALLYHPSDQRIQRYFIDSAYPERNVVQQVYDYLLSLPDDPIEITHRELRERLGLEISAEGVGTCERLLEKSGVLQRLEPHQNMAVIQIDSDLPTLVDLLPLKAKNARRVMRAAEKRVDELRHEPVYVALADLAEETELNIPAVRKALTDLAELECFQYVPPFRGRAIHFTRRDRGFHQLDIDFETLAARRRLDYQKLDRMVHYTQTHACRQLEILQYFGDSSISVCRRCDNCQGGGRGGRVTPSFEPPVDINADQALKTVVRIALSGVARARQRVGKSTVAGMLFGSRSAKMRKLSFDRLSTFGRLQALRLSDVNLLLDALISVHWVEQVEREKHRPLLKLTDEGRKIMLDQAHGPLPLCLPPSLQGRIHAAFPAWASTTGQPPAPATPPAPSEERETANGHPDRAHAAGTDTAANYYWTWRLLAEGKYSMEEIMEIRQIDQATLGIHMAQAIDDGRPLPDAHQPPSRPGNRLPPG